MNKLNSFICSLGVAIIVSVAIIGWEKTIDIRSMNYTPFLIYWYMIWKLLHDKNKD